LGFYFVFDPTNIKIFYQKIKRSFDIESNLIFFTFEAGFNV